MVALMLSNLKIPYSYPKGLFLKNFLIEEIIVLQNSVVFCRTSARISHRYTHVPSLVNLPPISLRIPPFTSQPVTEPLFEFPESHSKVPLAIYFTYGIVNFHVTLSIHLTFPLLPSSHVHRSVLCVCFSISALNVTVLKNRNQIIFLN